MTRKEPDEYFELAQRDAQHRHWKLIKHFLTLGFFVAIAALLFVLMDNVNWLEVSQALRAYAAMATSADRGAVRDLTHLER